MPNFKPCNYDQTSMVVINYQDQLQPGTFEYALHHLIENKLDLSVLYPKYQNEEGGRPEEIESLFEQILLVCEGQGLLGKESFAIDGCKIPSNAAKEWSGKSKVISPTIRVLK